MSIFEDLTSRDATRVRSGACAVRRLRDVQALGVLVKRLDEVKRATSGVALGGTLRPNSSHLEFAIKKLERIRDTSDCLCSLYPLDDQFDPRLEEKDENVRILGTALIEEKWVDFYACQCTTCNTTFRVEEREYHYPWWAWKRA